MEMSPSRPNPESLYVEWGFASFEIPWADVPDNIRRLLDKGRYFDGGVAMFINADTPKHIRQDNLLLLEIGTNLVLLWSSSVCLPNVRSTILPLNMAESHGRNILN